MWAWHFEYPDRPEWGRTKDLHIPAGRPVDVTITSSDVIHSFWVPRLAGKIDAIPGRANTLRIEADRPGRYGGTCAEFCGTGHTGMSFDVIAHPPATYEKTMAAMEKRAP